MATTRALASAGATVAIGHHAQIDQARTALEEVRRLGADGIEVSTGLTAADAAGLMVSQVTSEVGPVDILVNNAGAYPRMTWDERTRPPGAARSTSTSPSTTAPAALSPQR